MYITDEGRSVKQHTRVTFHCKLCERLKLSGQSLAKLNAMDVNPVSMTGDHYFYDICRFIVLVIILLLVEVEVSTTAGRDFACESVFLHCTRALHARAGRCYIPPWTAKVSTTLHSNKLTRAWSLLILPESITPTGKC